MGMCVNIFDNKLLICAFLMLWTCVSSSVFCIIMIEDGSNFLIVGPNQHNQLFGVKMDTWFKWWVTAIYTFVSTSIAAFASDSLCPFFTNVIEDHKTKHIPYSKFTCLMIVQVFTIYGVIMSVIGMFVALTQVDFMFIRISADLLVNAHTTYYFLRGKEVNAALYNEWKNTQHRVEDSNWVIFDESEHKLLHVQHVHASNERDAGHSSPTRDTQVTSSEELITNTPSEELITVTSPRI